MATRPRAEATSGARERILDAGLEAFARSGFDGTSTREIALAAGVQQGLLAYHFQSKEGLWQAVVDGGFVRVEAAVAALAPITLVEPRRRLRAQLERAFDVASAEPRFLRLLCHAALNGGPRLDWLTTQHIAPLQARWFGALLGLSSAAVPLGLERQLVGWLVADVVLAPALGAQASAVTAAEIGQRVDAWLGVDEPHAAAGAWSLAAARRRAVARGEPGP